MALTPDGRLAYVANSTSGTVSVIDTSVPKLYATVDVGGSPVGVALGPQGLPVYVTDNDDDSGALKELDTASNAVRVIPAGDGPLHGVAVVPSSGRIYVSHDTGDYVTALDDKRGIGDLSVGDSPRWLAVDQDARHIVVSNYLSGDVSIIDGASPSRPHLTFAGAAINDTRRPAATPPDPRPAPKGQPTTVTGRYPDQRSNAARSAELSCSAVGASSSPTRSRSHPR